MNKLIKSTSGKLNLKIADGQIVEVNEDDEMYVFPDETQELFEQLYDIYVLGYMADECSDDDIDKIDALTISLAKRLGIPFERVVEGLEE